VGKAILQEDKRKPDQAQPDQMQTSLLPGRRTFDDLVSEFTFPEGVYKVARWST